MKNIISTSAALFLLIAATPVFAQDPPTIPASTNPVEIGRTSLSGKAYGSVDFGGRVNTVSGDEARFQRYRDLTPGIYGTNMLYGKRTEDYSFEAQAWNVGYRDQKYQMDFQKVGKLTGSFLYDQIPLWISADTRTLYSEVNPGVFRLEDAMQQSLQAKTTTLHSYEDQAVPFDLKTMRRIGQADLVFHASPKTDLMVNVKNTNRDGHIPFGGTFGFSNAVEIPMPVDTRTTDIRTALEWGNGKSMLNVGWDGSTFNNDIESVIWDNPLQYGPDATNAPSQGRHSSWPDNTLNYIHATAATSLAARSRVTGYVAFGQGNSDATLVPMTINTAFAPIPLERSTSQAKSNMTIAQFTFASRPSRQVSFNAKYRYSDNDNQTPIFHLKDYIFYDGSLKTGGTLDSEYHSVTRSTFDADAAVQFMPTTSVKVGYTNQSTDYTHRMFDSTTENVFRASLDSSGNQDLMLRAQFEHRKRRGNDFQAAALAESGELPTMRHFDIADRDRARFTLIADALPGRKVGFHFTSGVGRDDYPDPTGGHGLQSYDSNQYSAGFNVTPDDRFNLTATYGWENYKSLQRSRTNGSAAEAADPKRDWTTDYNGDVNYFNTAFDIDHAIKKTLIRISADWNKTNDTYVYGVVAGGPNPAPEQLPAVTNELLRGEIDLTYDLSNNLKFGAAYWYEDYKVEDFALGPDTLSGLAFPPIEPGQSAPSTNALLLGYTYRPYTAHVGFVRLTYSW